jgi:hypothetical protein
VSLVAAEVVGAGQDPPVTDHDARAEAPAVAETNDRGADALGRAGDRA